MKPKVKIFQNGMVGKLCEMVNKFIEDNDIDVIDVIDVKYSSAASTNGYGGALFSAMIIYTQNDNH